MEDDWGADFEGRIVLTPKSGGPGSMWGRGPELLEGDEDTDGSCAAALGSPVRQTNFILYEAQSMKYCCARDCARTSLGALLFESKIRCMASIF